MIYYEHIYPTEINEQMLDAYLRKGWYRIQQMLITTDLITKEEEFIAVFWLRYRLQNYQHQKKSRKLLKAVKQFTVSIEPLQLSDELEDLFSKYRQEIDFDMSPTVKEYLQGNSDSSVFHTQLISIRDKDKLIAAGCYDEASESLMGILNIYDPAYKKYSLGKVLMLLKLEEAMRLQKTYFYPGYIGLLTPKFDYKVFPGREITEVYNRLTGAWQPYIGSNLMKLHDEMVKIFLMEQGN